MDEIKITGLKFREGPRDPAALDIPGLRRVGEQVIGGVWAPMPGIARLFAQSARLEEERVREQQLTTLNLDPIADTFKRIGPVFLEFAARFRELGNLIRQVTVCFPMDRRQARRVARRTGKTFRWKNGQPRWRDAPR